MLYWKSQVEDEWSNEQQACEETNITGDNLDLEVMTLSRQNNLSTVHSDLDFDGLGS